MPWYEKCPLWCWSYHSSLHVADLVTAESCPQVGVLTGPFPFHCLLQAMEREVKAALTEGKPEEVVSSAFKLRLSREDIQTLNNFSWLNDEVKLAAAQ